MEFLFICELKMQSLVKFANLTEHILIKLNKFYLTSIRASGITLKIILSETMQVNRRLNSA